MLNKHAAEHDVAMWQSLDAGLPLKLGPCNREERKDKKVAYRQASSREPLSSEILKVGVCTPLCQNANWGMHLVRRMLATSANVKIVPVQ